MKKKNIILSAILISIGSVSFAQNSVSLYGTVDAGINRVNNGTSTTIGLDSGIYSDSRLGIKGQENLGNGLKALFVLEAGVEVDTGQSTQAGTTFGRQAWLGLDSNSLGTIKLGLQHTPIRSVVNSIDPFSLGLAGDALKTLGSGGYQERVGSSISYTSPDFKGLSGQLSYGFGEVVGNHKDERAIGVGLTYNYGNSTFATAYNKLNGNQFGAPAIKDIFLGATHDFGIVKAHAGFAERKLSGPFSIKSKNYLLGASKQFGPHMLMASYIRNDVRNIANADSSTYAVGYGYSLSNRTNLYTSYGTYRNDMNSAVNVMNTGTNGSQFNMGVTHTF